MTVQTLKLGGKRFVVVPEKDFQRLKHRADEFTEQEQGDIAESQRRKAKGPSRPYAQLRKKLKLG